MNKLPPILKGRKASDTFMEYVQPYFISLLSGGHGRELSEVELALKIPWMVWNVVVMNKRKGSKGNEVDRLGMLETALESQGIKAKKMIEDLKKRKIQYFDQYNYLLGEYSLYTRDNPVEVRLRVESLDPGELIEDESMIDYKVDYVESVSKKLAAKINHAQIKEEATYGVICNYKAFQLVIKGANNETVGMLSAYTAYSEIYIDDIWVEPKHRKEGLGRKLLNNLETRFTGKGYNNINLVTSQFQAPDFYEKCGFELEFKRENIKNPKLTKFFFVKYFNDDQQTQGTIL